MLVRRASLSFVGFAMRAVRYNNLFSKNEQFMPRDLSALSEGLSFKIVNLKRVWQRFIIAWVFGCSTCFVFDILLALCVLCTLCCVARSVRLSHDKCCDIMWLCIGDNIYGLLSQEKKKKRKIAWKIKEWDSLLWLLGVGK